MNTIDKKEIVANDQFQLALRKVKLLARIDKDTEIAKNYACELKEWRRKLKKSLKETSSKDSLQMAIA